MCGTTITTSGEIPNRTQWNLISDVDFDEFSGEVNAEEVYRAATVAFRCPVSDHLWIYWEGFAKAPQLYQPIPGGERAL